MTFTPIIKIGELEIDILKRTVQVGTSELHLTSLEQSLLYLLAANAGRVVTREEILDSLWGTDCGRKQRGRPSDAQPAHATPGRLAGATFHRHGPTPGLPFLAHLHF